jgi:phosphate transport system substrate-binding protein
MFIVTPKDIKILNIQHPDDRNKQISILQYSGHTFRLAQEFGDNRDRAVTFSRHLTENMGKLCVLLEEPHLFSVWEQVAIDKYKVIPDELDEAHLHQTANHSVNGRHADVMIASAPATTAYLHPTPPVPPVLPAPPVQVRESEELEELEAPVRQFKLPLSGDRQDERPQKRGIWDFVVANRQKLIALGVILLAIRGLASLGWHIYELSLNSRQVEISPAKIPFASIDTSLPNPKVLTMDGSTTMVVLIQRLRNAYGELNPNIPTTYGQPDGRPNGSNKGLEALINRSVVLAATSRPLNPKEVEAGIQVVAIAHDSLAVVIGIDNPFKGGLTLAQLRGIYQGKIVNWSEVGGPNLPIHVINRSKNSGTRDMFQRLVLLGQEFAPNSSNFITWLRDETTDPIRVLGKDGIYYSTVSQLEQQEIVRIIPIDGAYPNDPAAVQSGKYPISRNVYLAFPQPTSPAVKAFIDLALSPQGQQTLLQAGFMPMH